MCKKIVFDSFSQNYKATIGVDFYSKLINWDNSTVVRLQLWDIAGKLCNLVYLCVCLRAFCTTQEVKDLGR